MNETLEPTKENKWNETGEKKLSVSKLPPSRIEEEERGVGAWGAIIDISKLPPRRIEEERGEGVQ